MIKFGTGGWRAIIADEFTKVNIRLLTAGLSTLMQEEGLASLFNEKCGDLQYLDKNARDSTAISYEEKLQSFLTSTLVSDELAKKVRSAFDAYINIIGGLQLNEPGADLPVVLALASSYRDTPIPDDLVAIGEVGLTGEIRGVSNIGQRLTEVARLGFNKCIIPKSGTEKLEIPEGLTVYRVRNLREAIEIAL